MNKTMKKSRKGFSLVELVIAILIIAVLVAAVFAGGSIIIRNSQVSRTTSDLHNFSIAMETWMNQNPTLSNILATGDTDVNNIQNKATGKFNLTGEGSLVVEFNKLLSEDYKLVRELDTKAAGAVPTSGGANLPQYVSVTVGDESRVFESAKTDAWGNPYYVVFDCEDRNTTQSEFYVYVISAGPNATTDVDGTINNDDVFVLAQYTNGTVVSNIYNMNDVNAKAYNKTSAVANKYSGGEAKADLASTPVNFTK